MAVEAARSCGYRKVGGLYLVGGGSIIRQCDRLPYKIENCPTCGGGLKFSRGWTWLDWRVYAGDHPGCHDNMNNNCPLCQPKADNQPYGLIWIGEKFYSPDAFVKESLQLGISRRIPFTGEIQRAPKLLKLGQTWVVFAHKHVIPLGKDEHNVEIFAPAVFHAFRPERLELLVWQKDAISERIAELEKAGITPVIIPDGDKDHDPLTPIGLAKDDKVELESKVAFNDLRSRLGR